MRNVKSGKDDEYICRLEAVKSPRSFSGSKILFQTSVPKVVSGHKWSDQQSTLTSVQKWYIQSISIFTVLGTPPLGVIKIALSRIHMKFHLHVRSLCIQRRWWRTCVPQTLWNV